MTRSDLRDARDTAGLALLLFALGFVVMRCTGCTPAERLTVENASAVAQYDEGLVKCKEKAKAARSLDVFDACDAELVRSYCRSSESLRREWPRCKETP